MRVPRYRVHPPRSWRRYRVPAETLAERRAWVIAAAGVAPNPRAARYLAFWRWVAGMRAEFAWRDVQRDTST